MSQLLLTLTLFVAGILISNSYLTFVASQTTDSDCSDTTTVEADEPVLEEQFNQPRRYAPRVNVFIMDTSVGRPAGGMNCTFSVQEKEDEWKKLDESQYGCSFPMDGPVGTIYKLELHTEDYFAKQNLVPFYPYAEIIIEKLNEDSMLLPVIISPYGYSVYKGHSG